MGTIDLSQLLEEEVELRAIRGDKFNVTFRGNLAYGSYFTLNAVVQQIGSRDFVFYSIETPKFCEGNSSGRHIKVHGLKKSVSSDMKTVKVSTVGAAVYNAWEYESAYKNQSFTFKAGYAPEL